MKSRRYKELFFRSTDLKRATKPQRFPDQTFIHWVHLSPHQLESRLPVRADAENLTSHDTKSLVSEITELGISSDSALETAKSAIGFYS